MSAILNFKKWKSLYEQATPKSPEGFTSAVNGIVYKYPFADDLAKNKYVYFGQTNITADGASSDAATVTAALKSLSPKLAGVNVVQKDPEKKPAGLIIIKGVQAMLETCAKNGVGAMSAEQLVAKAKSTGDEAGASDISKMLEYMNLYETAEGTKGAYTDFKTNWPKVLVAQRTAAGLPATL